MFPSLVAGRLTGEQSWPEVRHWRQRFSLAATWLLLVIGLGAAMLLLPTEELALWPSETSGSVGTGAEGPPNQLSFADESLPAQERVANFVLGVVSSLTATAIISLGRMGWAWSRRSGRSSTRATELAAESVDARSTLTTEDTITLPEGDAATGQIALDQHELDQVG